MPLLSRTLAALERGIADGWHRGAQLYVSQRGEIIADLALGEARQGCPMQRDTLMPWLSSGKPMTAVAVAQQMERGRLLLDQPVASIIPRFTGEGRESITIRHLLTHTAGLRLADKVREDLSWEETLDFICAAPLEAGWVPGQKAGYSTQANWFLLGEIVRRVDGRSIGTYVREEIFLPLGMKDSWLCLSPEQCQLQEPRLGFMFAGEPPLLRAHPTLNSEAEWLHCRPGSSARGPIRELGRFNEALLAGGEFAGRRILKTETAELFTSRHRVGLFDTTFQHKLDFGLGFIVNSNQHGAETVPYGYGRHASERAFGHSGAQSSCAFADPAHGLTVAWVCNGMPGERRHQQRQREINTALYEDLGLA